MVIYCIIEFTCIGKVVFKHRLVSGVDKVPCDLVRVQTEKCVSEEILQMVGLDVTHLRPSVIIGHQIVDKPSILLCDVGARFTENVDRAACRPIVNKF